MGKMNLDVLYNRKGTDCVKWDHKDFVDSIVSDDSFTFMALRHGVQVADEITGSFDKAD